MKKTILFFIFIIFINSVYAFGVTPAQKVFNFEPETEQKFSFEIVNYENKNVNLVILPQGELNQSIALSNYSVHLTPEVKSVTIEYSIKIPAKMKPGYRGVDIAVIEVPDTSVSSTTYIGAIVEVITKVLIDVPYPGKYIESDLSVSTSNDGKTVFVLPLVNKGANDIKRASATIDILTPLNEKIATLQAEEMSVLSGERKKIEVKWDSASAPAGRYLAVATLSYDEETLTFEKQFTTGNDGLQIKSVEVNDFNLGGIAKFEFLVQNNFNYPTSGTYILMQVFDKKGDVMTEFKSAGYDIQPFESELIVSFWDTEGVKEGTYEAMAFINSGDSLIQKPFTLEISDDDITVVGIGYVVKSASSKGGGSLVTILTIAIIVLVLINITWFLVLRKKVKK